jgi:hypothetical protein
MNTLTDTIGATSVAVILPTVTEILPPTQSVDITAGVTVAEVKRRGRKPSGFVLQIPDGEFNMKDLMALNGKLQGFIYPFLKKSLASGAVKEIRSVKAAKQGRPSLVYSKV